MDYLNQINLAKATGLDQIGPKILHCAAPVIAESLTYIYNLCITKNVFPTMWKEAKVAPLHKGGSKDVMDNFRPISVLPLLSKVLEKHVQICFIEYLNRNTLIHDTQSGFRPNHSCETALLHMTEQWIKAVDEGKLVGTIFVDFRKAFDLVDHEILLSKLSMYNCSQESLHWFRSYLSHRSQKLHVNGKLSDSENVLYGVPQGSILGPILFLLFINDLPIFLSKSLEDGQAYLFADDTTLSKSSQNIKQLTESLQKVLNLVLLWSKENGMVLNSSKTRCMLITTQQKRHHLVSDKLNLKVAGEEIKQVDKEKVLGVTIANNLSWDEHISNVSKRMSMKGALLNRIKLFLSSEQRIQFYKAFIQPHMDYCSIVWSCASKSSLSRILKIQKRVCRSILNVPYDTPSEPLF